MRKAALSGGGTGDFEEAQSFLYKRVASAPRPLPAGRFPAILAAAEGEGFGRDMLLNVLDSWLNYGFCRIADPITQDISITPAGEKYFY